MPEASAPKNRQGLKETDPAICTHAAIAPLLYSTTGPALGQDVGKVPGRNRLDYALKLNMRRAAKGITERLFSIKINNRSIYSYYSLELKHLFFRINLAIQYIIDPSMTGFIGGPTTDTMSGIPVHPMGMK